MRIRARVVTLACAAMVAVGVLAIAPTAASADTFWGPTTGIPVSGHVMTFKVLNRTNGQYPDSQVYWTFNGVTHTIAQQQYVDVPVISAARMVFHLGSPTSQYTDFIELNTTAAWIGVNTTRVDGFGLKLALRVHPTSGADSTVGETQPVFAQTRNATFQAFINAVPAQFQHLAQVDAPYQIPAPSRDAAFQAGGQYQNYFKSYATSLGYTVSTSDILGCAGSLASNAALCAALNRHTSLSFPRRSGATPAAITRPARPTTTPSSGTPTTSAARPTASRTTTSTTSPAT